MIRLITGCILICTISRAQSPAGLVNPFIGASTSAGAAGIYHGLGKTFPGATTPYGMVQVSPNTITGGDNGSGYSYEHTSIEGFAFTQMSGIGWNGDLGNFLVMPFTGPLKTKAGKQGTHGEGYRSDYLKSSEKAAAGYYSVLLSGYNIKAEMTAAPHSGMLRFTFPAGRQSGIQIDLARRVGGTSTRQYVKVLNDSTITGWMKCTPDGGGWGNGDGHADYTVYFYAVFSKPLRNYGVWSADIPDSWTRKLEDVESDRYQQQIGKAEILKGIKEKEGKHLGFFTGFDTKEGEQVQMKAGISFVSMDGAAHNLQQEIRNWDFDAVRNKAHDQWNRELARIKVSGGTTEEKKVFYTALYHTMIDPRIIQDADGKYMGGDGKVHTSSTFNKRTIFSGWDVFRSQMPLQTLIHPSLINDLINSLITLAKEKKKDYLERWELLNAYSGCMLGNPAVSVITDAYAKGIRNYNVPEAYRLSVNSQEKFGNGTLGYTPGDLSLSYTLEYAYTDWCVSRMAQWLHHPEDEKKYARRGENYKNVFDTEKGWFRPRDKEGKWLPWPDSGRMQPWYGTMESNPYQQGWFVPQDVDGMVALMGGKQKVISDLEHFFEQAPENMMWNDYYNHANEPVHHVPFLFNRLGQPWLTQKWTRAICRRAYHDKVEGLVGNEDVGQMSAWYVLAAIGLHPVCPGDTRQEITSPVFDKIQMGKFTIKTINNSAENIYIQSARLNGKPYSKCHIDFRDVAKGGVLELVMGPTPNQQWGINN
ncbi:glycoside hydrolase family 92 protein [Chitinophaga oryziterrae]|uniref:Glycoside hydrolase family 92 protein n=1 Tax=Chitinophaga oryziterrae TaxID=1031224 RepID=A0A6N8JD92_9BACT|nr:GH92 family glycosyl hydrolase [Chitinophaga oryziterrae]MVT42904.1 glycoside hydrolase family 92 protein [Chitinophaga oryziterrae]